MAGKMRAGALAALVGCALFSAACSNIETPDFAADGAEIMAAAEKAMGAKWQPIPLRVGVAPMRSAPEESAAEINKEDSRRWILPTDEKYMNEPIEGLNARLIAVMSEYRMFESIAPISSVSATTTQDELLALALAQRFDIVLQPTIRLHDVTYVDSNGAYGWNMFVWWMVSPIISLYIADEDFGISLNVDLRMFPVTQNRQIDLASLYNRDQRIERSLDDLDQGFHVFSIFSTPGYMGEDNWKRIGDKMRPIAENELKKALLRYITDPLKKRSETKAFRDDVRKRVALVIGVDGITVPPKFAGEDAEAMEAHLLFAENLPVPGGALRKLVGSRAGKGAIETEARELASLAGRNDDVILMFSGAGTVDDQSRLALVLAQSGGQASQTIVLEELVDKLITNDPRSITLILDCSFTAPGDRRCILTEDRLKELLATHHGRSLFEPIQEKLKAAGTRCVILAASDAIPGNPHGMRALEIDELSHGLFTSFALDAMQGRVADTSGNGTVSFAEFETFVKGKVSHVAKLEREYQHGYYYISEDFKDDFALPSGARPPR